MKARYYIERILFALIGSCTFYPGWAIFSPGIQGKHPKKWWIIHFFVSLSISASALPLYLFGIYELGIDILKALSSGNIGDMLFGNIFTTFGLSLNLVNFIYVVVYIVEKGPPFSPRSSEEEVEESI